VYAQPLPIKDFGELALKCGPNVAPVTLASIAQTESGFNPFLIHDNNTKKAFNLGTDVEAAETATSLIAAGHSVDLGIMQINSHNLPALGLKVQDAFDPCVSIGAASIILSDAYVGGENHEAQQQALRVTISQYNTGDTQRGFTNGYVGKVEASARKVVPALDVGMGQSDIPAAPQPQQVAAPVDPNAPPAWDVWGSFEYSTASETEKKAENPRASDAALFVQATNSSAIFPQLRKE
jgi:type IV secretion system protein VirB1